MGAAAEYIVVFRPPEMLVALAGLPSVLHFSHFLFLCPNLHSAGKEGTLFAFPTFVCMPSLLPFPLLSHPIAFATFFAFSAR
jgi:hypothetical protein